MNKKLEEENRKLRESLDKTNQELQKSKYYQVTPKQWLGGGIGILCYVILKAIGGYGWHGGDVIGLFLLGFLPGAALAAGDSEARPARCGLCPHFLNPLPLPLR